MEEKLYTIQEVAERHKCSADTVRNWIKAGKLEREKIGRLVRITAGALEKFERENKRQGAEIMNNAPELKRNPDGSIKFMGGGDGSGETALAYTSTPGKYAIFKNGEFSGLYAVIQR